jgi:DNA-directed RNA polymerase subunit K/omega
MNIELTQKALAKVGNPHILVNLISRRVRQLNSGGPASRPLIDEPGASASDTALLELIHDKLGWLMADGEEPPVETNGAAPKRKRARKTEEPAE